MKRSNLNLLTLTGLTLLLVASAGCKPSVGIQHRIVEPELFESLKVGLPLREARATLGPEDARHEARFGDVVGEGWDGVVLEYGAGQDPMFVTMPHPRSHRLVFAVVEQDTLLNHWELAEATLVDDD